MTTVIFKPFLSDLENRFRNAAYSMAGSVVDQLEKTTYEKSRGHWPDSYAEKLSRESFFGQARQAHTDALIAAVSKEVEAFAIAKMKEKAAEWEAAAKKGGAA